MYEYVRNLNISSPAAIVSIPDFVYTHFYILFISYGSVCDGLKFLKFFGYFVCLCGQQIYMKKPTLMCYPDAHTHNRI